MTSGVYITASQYFECEPHCPLSWRRASTCLHQGKHGMLACHASCLSPSSPGMLSDYQIKKPLVLFRRFLRSPAVKEDGICRLADLRIHFAAYLIPLGRAEVV